MAASKQTYTRVLQCSSASVGLAQARPNYSNIQTPTPLRARMGVAKCLLAFDSPLQSSNEGCQTCNSFQQSLRRSNRGSQMSFNNLCRAQTAVREGLLAIDKVESCKHKTRRGAAGSPRALLPHSTPNDTVSSPLDHLTTHVLKL